MKIRIKGNSIRFRLTKSEVEKLGSDGSIEEYIDFGNTILKYAVQSSLKEEQLRAACSDNSIVLYFPKDLLSQWISTEKVGYRAQSGSLSILIEKDFTCLDNVEEDQSDNYPNPLLKIQ